VVSAADPLRSLILVRKPEGNRPVKRTTRRRVDSNERDLEAIEWDGVDRIDLAQDRDRWRGRERSSSI
jgi:hypothetical protein